jgi:hypothetical protein
MSVTFTDTIESKQVINGALTAVGFTPLPFKPVPVRGFNVSLWGTFVGSVSLFRSFDGGVTLLPVTGVGPWTAPVSIQTNEPEYGVQYFLDVTAFTSGTINYRLSQ